MRRFDPFTNGSLLMFAKFFTHTTSSKVFVSLSTKTAVFPILSRETKPANDDVVKGDVKTPEMNCSSLHLYAEILSDISLVLHQITETITPCTCVVALDYRDDYTVTCVLHQITESFLTILARSPN